MRVVLDNGTSVELGDTESAPTIGITDYSRRVTDDFGVTTVVERGFARRMSVRLAVPFDQVDIIQRQLASLRATAAQWVADERFDSLSVRGFYKDFDIDLATSPISSCTLTVEGLLASDSSDDAGADPAPTGQVSTLRLLQPTPVTYSVLTSSSVAETDYAEWSAGVSYPLGATVIKAATHRVYESAVAANLGNDPAGASGKWVDVGPTNRWAMFDQALGTSTTATSSIAVTLKPGTAGALALLDVVATSVRVQASGYDRTQSVTGASITFLDVPSAAASITVTITGSGAVSVGTLLVGRLTSLGITEASPTAGITDYSRKVVDDFGGVTINERAWAKRMTAKALIRTDAIDEVASRVTAVRARPSLWIGQVGIDSLTLYGFFKDFAIEVGETVSKLSLSVEGLSKAAPIPRAPTVMVPRGLYNSALSYADGDVVQYQGSTWIYINSSASTGNAPPSLPVTENAYWRAFARAGADGETSYVHFAYSDSADGTVNFTTGAPAGRAYIGTYSDFEPAGVAAPAFYAWSRYAGPPAFGLAVTGSAYLRGNGVFKATSTGAWDAQGFSTEGWRGGASVSFRGSNPFGNAVGGLNSDPSTSAHYDTIDYAWFLGGGGVGSNGSQIIVNGASIGVFGGGWNGSTTFQIVYDNRTVRWLKDGVQIYSLNVAANLLLYFDSSILESNVGVTDISFLSAGKSGVDGLDGTNGAPGRPGDDGRTNYVHYAYANSPDGAVDFDLNQPNGRAYEGSYSDFTAADSTNPAAYVWREYRGPPFGLAARGNAVVAGAMVVKSGGAAAWDSDAYSTVGFRGGCVTSFRLTSSGESIAGLNTDPTADASYISIDYAIYRIGGQCFAFESGANVGLLGPCDQTTRFSLEYTGSTVRYLAQGTLLREVSVATGLTFYFDSSISTPGGRIEDISFAARGSDGVDGLDGTNGLNGTNGQSIHIAYADNATGTVNFTTGAAAGRAYIGVYTDTNPGSDSTNPAAYGWTLIRGADGANGLPGPGGYVHIAYADNSTGTLNFHLSDPTGRKYIGTYTDQTAADSTNPAVYAWQLVKGADGAQGAAGVSAPQPVVVTGNGSALAPILLAAGQTLTLEAATGVQSTQNGTVTLQILAALGTGGLNVVGSGTTFVGPGEPGYASATGSITNNTSSAMFVQAQVAISGPGGYSVTGTTTNYLKAA